MKKSLLVVVLAFLIVPSLPAAPQTAPAPIVTVAPSTLLAIDQNRISIVEGIVGNWRESLSNAWGAATAEKESELRSALVRLRADRLLAASLAGTLDGLALAIREPERALPGHSGPYQAGSTRKTLGDPDRDLVYTPITPCRIVDTRNGTGAFGAPLTGPTVLDVTTNLASFLAQGGDAGACGLPAGGAAAIAVVVTVLGANFDAFLAAGNSATYNQLVQSVVMNFSAGQGIANTAIVPLDVSAPSSPRFHVTLPPQVSTHVLVDAVGFLKAPGGTIGDVTGVIAGPGLSGGATSGNATLSIATEFRLPQGCNNGQTAKWSNGAWTCAADMDTNNTANDARYFRQGGNLFVTTARIGTADNNPTEILANGSRVMRYAPTTAGPNLLGGNPSNFIFSNVRGATVAGGGIDISNPDPDTGSTQDPNGIGSHYGTVGGGAGNQAGSLTGVVDGGMFATAAGGELNRASGPGSAIGGGAFNAASGAHSTVPGGSMNTAQGAYSFAGGRRAIADGDGCFVWADGHTGNETRCNGSNRFVARAIGGFFMLSAGDNEGAYSGAALLPGATAWTVLSDRASKENVTPVDVDAVLRDIVAMPIATWNWKTQHSSIRHMGPMAQDFRAAFGLGETPTGISTVDADGVAFAAIQGLHRRVEARDRRIAELEKKADAVDALRRELRELQALVRKLAASAGGSR